VTQKLQKEALLTMYTNWDSAITHKDKLKTKDDPIKPKPNLYQFIHNIPTKEHGS
jgi:hypothetical protein